MVDYCLFLDCQFDPFRERYKLSLFVHNIIVTPSFMVVNKYYDNFMQLF